jgi:hypothetical protein
VDGLSGYNANVITLTVGDELSGQIASYVAGGATDDQGAVSLAPVASERFRDTIVSLVMRSDKRSQSP